MEITFIFVISEAVRGFLDDQNIFITSNWRFVNFLYFILDHYPCKIFIVYIVAYKRNITIYN